MYTAYDAEYYLDELAAEEFENTLSIGVGIAEDFSHIYNVYVECTDWDEDEGYTFVVSEPTYVGPPRREVVYGWRENLQDFFDAGEG